MDTNRRRYLEDTANNVKNFLAKHKVLIRYHRDEKTNKKVGVVIAYCVGDSLYMGWSKCNTHGDTFDRNVGLQKAIDRSMHIPVDAKYPHYPPKMAWSLEFEFDDLYERSLSYFQQLKKAE